MEREVPFSNGTQYLDWRYRNCDRCLQRDKCAIEDAISACAAGEPMPDGMMKRMGYDPDAYTWPCPEKVVDTNVPTVEEVQARRVARERKVRRRVYLQTFLNPMWWVRFVSDWRVLRRWERGHERRQVVTYRGKTLWGRMTEWDGLVLSELGTEDEPLNAYVCSVQDVSPTKLHALASLAATFRERRGS